MEGTGSRGDGTTPGGSGSGFEGRLSSGNVATEEGGVEDDPSPCGSWGKGPSGIPGELDGYRETPWSGRGRTVPVCRVDNRGPDQSLTGRRCPSSPTRQRTFLSPPDPTVCTWVEGSPPVTPRTSPTVTHVSSCFVDTDKGGSSDLG